jgi:hypothetical protein
MPLCLLPVLNRRQHTRDCFRSGDAAFAGDVPASEHDHKVVLGNDDELLAAETEPNIRQQCLVIGM